MAITPRVNVPSTAFQPGETILGIGPGGRVPMPPIPKTPVVKPKGGRTSSIKTLSPQENGDRLQADVLEQARFLARAHREEQDILAGRAGIPPTGVEGSFGRFLESMDRRAYQRDWAPWTPRPSFSPTGGIVGGSSLIPNISAGDIPINLATQEAQNRAQIEQQRNVLQAQFGPTVGQAFASDTNRRSLTAREMTALNQISEQALGLGASAGQAADTVQAAMMEMLATGRSNPLISTEDGTNEVDATDLGLGDAVDSRIVGQTVSSIGDWHSSEIEGLSVTNQELKDIMDRVTFPGGDLGEPTRADVETLRRAVFDYSTRLKMGNEEGLNEAVLLTMQATLAEWNERYAQYIKSRQAGGAAIDEDEQLAILTGLTPVAVAALRGLSPGVMDEIVQQAMAGDVTHKFLEEWLGLKVGVLTNMDPDMLSSYVTQRVRSMEMDAQEALRLARLKEERETKTARRTPWLRLSFFDRLFDLGGAGTAWERAERERKAAQALGIMSDDNFKLLLERAMDWDKRERQRDIRATFASQPEWAGTPLEERQMGMNLFPNLTEQQLRAIPQSLFEELLQSRIAQQQRGSSMLPFFQGRFPDVTAQQLGGLDPALAQIMLNRPRIRAPSGFFSPISQRVEGI